MRTSLVARSLAYLGGAAFILLIASATGILDFVTSRALTSGGLGGDGIFRKPTPGYGARWMDIHAGYANDLALHDAGEASRCLAADC